MYVLFSAAHIFVSAIKHRKKIIAALFLAFLMPSVLAIHKLPKKFQSSALFNFHSDFSKIPASSEFFSEIYDPNEIRAEKEAILVGVLSDDFLLETTAKYFGDEQAESEWKVQGLRKDIRFVPLSRTTYQLVVVQQSPEITQKIAWDVLERLEETLRTERLVRMQSVYGSITQQLNELTIEGGDKDLSIQLDATRLRIETEIQKLERMYTAEHPRLARLRSQLQNLNRPSRYNPNDPLGRGQIENWASLRGILLTRQALLQVAIRMEEKGTLSHIKLVKEPDLPQWPVAPKKSILYLSALITSLALGFAIGAALSLLKDLNGIFPEITSSWQTFKEKLNQISQGKKDTNGV